MGVINDLITGALVGARSGAMEKIAQEVTSCEECGKAVPADAKMCKECAEKKAKGEAKAVGGTPEEGPNPNKPQTSQEKTSSDLTDPVRIEKLATALDYLAANSHLVDWEGVSKLSTESTAGPGKGPNTLPNDENAGVEKMNPDLGGSTTNVIPNTTPPEPARGPGAIKTDDRANKGNRPAGVGSSVDKIKQAMLGKVAEGPATNPNVEPEDRPPQVERSAEVAKQEKLIADNKSAVNFTIQQAREAPKKQTSEHLNEPMLDRKADKTLDQAFGADRVNEAGAKVASAQRFVQKIAEERCTCGGGENSCGACKIKTAIEQRLHSTAEELENAQNPGATGTVQ